jgi:hypothetical protein
MRELWPISTHGRRVLHALACLRLPLSQEAKTWDWTAELRQSACYANLTLLSSSPGNGQPVPFSL